MFVSAPTRLIRWWPVTATPTWAGTDSIAGPGHRQGARLLPAGCPSRACDILATRLTVVAPCVLIIGMLFMNESEAPDGHTRARSDSRPAPSRDTKRFVFFRRGKGRAAPFASRVVGLYLPRYVGRIDARLCTDGRVPAPDAVIDPLINGGESIKTGEVSDVYRVEWAGRDLVVKRYNHVGLLHSLRHTVKSSRARRGWINGQRLLEMGIPTPRPIAYIDEFHGPLLWRSYLITEFADGRRLNEVLEDGNVADGTKRRLIHQVLKLIHRLSLHGVNHGDTKHTNILCAEGRVVLTDLDSVETHQWEWLHRRRQAGDIARFLRDMGDSDAQENCGDGPDGPPVPSGGTTRLNFISEMTADGEMHINRDFPCGEELREALWHGEEGIRRRYVPTIMESSRNSRVLRFRASCGGERTIYFKEYLRRSPLDWLKQLFYPCRAMRAFHASLMLSEAGFLTPPVVAAGWAGRGLLGKRSFLATEEVTGVRPVHNYLVPPHCDGNGWTLRDRRELLRSLGRTIGRMHRAGITHGDLRPGNVLARKVTDGWEFFFIDNERTRRRRILLASSRLKNLVQINMLPHGISRTDRMRFFQAYMLANPSVCGAYKQWARRVMAVTNRRFRLKGWLLKDEDNAGTGYPAAAHGR